LMGRGHLPGGTFLVLTREEGKECPHCDQGCPPFLYCKGRHDI
jgi:hypothetical protein